MSQWCSSVILLFIVWLPPTHTRKLWYDGLLYLWIKVIAMAEELNKICWNQRVTMSHHALWIYQFQKKEIEWNNWWLLKWNLQGGNITQKQLPWAHSADSCIFQWIAIGKYLLIGIMPHKFIELFDINEKHLMNQQLLPLYRQEWTLKLH